jgi:heme exporter protein D
MIVATRLSAVWQGAGVAAAALVCYLVSQSVAAERANVARLDLQIARAKNDIGKLSIELDARSRMGQLERWNSEVLALSAPTPEQFVADGVQLAALQHRDNGPDLPLNPAITSQMAPTHVAYSPDTAAETAPAPVPVVQRAVATVMRQDPMLRQVAYVRPRQDRLGPPAPAPTEPVAPISAKMARHASSLLPDDIGALIAAENKSGKKAGAKAER